MKSKLNELDIKKSNNSKSEIKISVIMPVYNAEKFLKQSVESVLNQSLKEIELICVDDGSTDNSLNILNEYKELDNRVVIIKQKNLNAGAARNNAFKQAKGEFIHFLDADDWLNLKAYEKLYNLMKNSDADLAVFLYTRFNNITSETNNVKLFPGEIGSHREVNFIQNYKNFCDTSVVPWNKLFRKSYLKKIDAKFDEIVCANDRAFYFQTITQAKKIINFSEYLIYYRTNNNNSLVGSGRLKHFNCHLTANKRILEMTNNFDINIKKCVFNAIMKDLFSFYVKSDETTKKENALSIYKLLQKQLMFFNIDEFKNEYWYSSAKIISLLKIDEEREIIPVIFATNNSYAPFLDVSIISLIENMSEKYFYDIYIFETDLNKKNIEIFESHEGNNFRINAINLSAKLNSINLPSRGHYSKEMYYRILIPELLFVYDKAVYLDSDIVVNRDVSELFNLHVDDCTVAGVHNPLSESMFRYVNNVLKVRPETYFNSGILLFNINKFMKEQIKTKCFDLLKVKENLVCPDQDLLNLACRGTLKLIDSGWNYQWHNYLPQREKIVELSKKDLNNAQEKKYIIHYTSGIKAWSFPEYEDSIIFWNYAMQSKFLPLIQQIGQSKKIHTSVNDMMNTLIGKIKFDYSKKENVFEVKNIDENGLLNLPKKFPGFFKCWKENGFKYTIIRTFFGRKKARLYAIKREQNAKNKN